MKNYYKVKIFNLNCQIGGAALTSEESAFECPICMELYNDNNYKPTTLPCGHSFCMRHLPEISVPYNGSPTCPICRQPFVKDNQRASISLKDGAMEFNTLKKEKEKLDRKLQKMTQFAEAKYDKLNQSYQKVLRERDLAEKKLTPPSDKLVNRKTDYLTESLPNNLKIAAVAAEITEVQEIDNLKLENVKMRKELKELKEIMAWREEMQI